MTTTTTTVDQGLPGIYWEGIYKPLWDTRDLLAAHLLRLDPDLIDQHKEWDDDQCEYGPECRYCPTLSVEELGHKGRSWSGR